MITQSLKDFKPKKDCYYAYIMTCDNRFDERLKGLKVGFASNPKYRMTQVQKETISRPWKNQTLVAAFEFNNAEDAYEMEVCLHRFYKAKGYRINGKDYFYGEYSQKDLAPLQKLAIKIQIDAEFFVQGVKNV